MDNKTLPLVSPFVIPESIIISDEGELPRGLYYYVITPVGYKDNTSSHILQVYAPHKHNSICFEWKTSEMGIEHRVYRGTTLGKYDGFFTIYSVPECCYFYDNGMGVLNELKTNI